MHRWAPGAESVRAPACGTKVEKPFSEIGLAVRSATMILAQCGRPLPCSSATNAKVVRATIAERHLSDAEQSNLHCEGVGGCRHHIYSGREKRTKRRRWVRHEARTQFYWGVERRGYRRTSMIALPVIRATLIPARRRNHPKHRKPR